jgi:hypothetical protein
VLEASTADAVRGSAGERHRGAGSGGRTTGADATVVDDTVAVVVDAIADFGRARVGGRVCTAAIIARITPGTVAVTVRVDAD